MRMKRKSGNSSAEKIQRPALPGNLIALFACLLCCVVIAPTAFGRKKKQAEPRVVTGTVVDPSDNPIAGAIVEMADERTGKKLTMVTQENGEYLFSGLDEDHDYTLVATYKGISSDTRTASSFDTRKRIVLNFQIPPPKE